MRSRPQALAAVALLCVATSALAWLPALVDAPGVPLFGLLAAIAGAAFLALATLALRETERASGRAARSPLFAPRRIVAIALALRLVAAIAPAWLSDDLERYRFEGAVQRAGFSPFVHAPDDPALDGVDDTQRARVSHREVPAAYPPAAQLLFRFGPAREWTWKLLVAAIDGLFVAWLARRTARAGRPAAALLHAWNPLVILCAAGNGHVDAIGWSLVVAALAASPRSLAGELVQGGAAGLAALIKPQAAVATLALALGRRWRAVAAALVAALAVWVPFARDGIALLDGTRRYAHDWEFNGLLHPALVRLAEWIKRVLEEMPFRCGLWHLRGLGYAIVPTQLARTLALLLFLVVATRLARSLRERPLRLAFLLIAAFLATSPTVHPWYVAWLAPFLPLLPPALVRAPLLLTATVLAGFAPRVALVGGAEWSEPAWVALATWLAPCALLVIDLRHAPSADEPDLDR